MAQITEPVDTLGADSTATLGEILPDSLANAGEEVCAMVFEPVDVLQPEKHEADSSGLSWILTILLALFVIISLRFRKNTRFFMAMINELTEVRERHNTFDETVREESFLFLLNLLWCLSAGVLLLAMVEYFNISLPLFDNITNSFPFLGAVVCVGIAVVYTLFMLLAYFIVGMVFADYTHTQNWVRGFLSAQGLDSLFLFPLSLLSITIPTLNSVWLVIGAVSFALTKIIFIYKSFRIFFHQTASWVIFLYYLCSLEIVPLILTGLAAFHFCSLLA